MVRERDRASKEKNKRDFDRRKKAKDKGIEVGDQVMVARRKTTIKTPWDPNPYKVVDIHHRRATIQRGRSRLQRDTGDVKKLKSRPPHLQHSSSLLQGTPCSRDPRKREEELDYDIDLPVAPAAPAPPPQNPFLVYPAANIQPIIGRLARRERWLLAPLADMFIEPPGLQQRRSGRTVQVPDRWVAPMFRQEGGNQVEDRRWHQQEYLWEAEMIPSDIDMGGRDSRPPTAETTPVHSEEEDSGEERWVSMVAEMVEEERQPEGSNMRGFLPQQMARVELMDPTWLGHDEPLLLEQTAIPPQQRAQLSPQARRRNQSRAKFRR